MKDLLSLFFVFFKIGSVTFGGGLAMLPILEKELVEKKKWTDSEELLDFYAVSQATPGIIAVNVATFIGHKRKGIAGGIAATLGIIAPSIIIITLIAEFISNFESILWVQKALRGINVAVCALLTYSVFNLTKKVIKKWWSLIFYGAAFVAIYFFHVHSVIVIVAAIAGGILAGFISGNLGKKKVGVDSAASASADSGVSEEPTASASADSGVSEELTASASADSGVSEDSDSSDDATEGGNE